jgi:Arc/MetJ family transcription regulator
VHINLEDELVAELDRRVGPRQRSAFIAGAVRRALEDELRWELIESALDSIPDAGHAWDDDAAEWVRAQRRGDVRRVG